MKKRISIEILLANTKELPKDMEQFVRLLNMAYELGRKDQLEKVIHS
jgi:hypothetical protein